MKKVILLIVSVMALVGCGKEDVIVEETEYIDRIEYREKGDRLVDDFSGEEHEKEKRLLKQYDTIDRPIIVNSLREIEMFAKDKEGYMDDVYIGVGLDSDYEEELIGEGLKKLGNTLEGNVDALGDLEQPYPYLDNKLINYEGLVVKQIKKYVKDIKEEYDAIISLYINRPKTQKVIDKRNLKGLEEELNKKDTIISSSIIYIQEMDKEANLIREQIGEAPKDYGEILAVDLEEVSEYIVPEDNYKIEIIEKTTETVEEDSQT